MHPQKKLNNETNKPTKIPKKDGIHYVIENKSYNTNEILVKFKDGVSDQRIKNIQEELNLSMVEFNKKTKMYRMKMIDDSSIENKIHQLNDISEIEFAEPNHAIKLY